MTRFSEALNKMLTQKDISVYNLSQNSGVNRTTIQKMKAGTRLPASEAVVRQLADHLMLTPVEYNDFVRDYRISRMGEENYLRRQYVKEIIESFYDSHTVSNVVIESNGSNILHMPSDHEVVNGTYNVKRLIHAVLDNEANKKDGYVHMLTQPDFSYIYECISTIDFNKNHTPITNIISFDNMGTENTSLYNLRLFKALVPMLFTCENFEALCVHEYVSSVFNKTSLLPYKIFTSDYCLLISFEQETALIFQRGPVYDIIAHSFDQKRLLAQPIYKIIKANPQTYSEITPKFMDFKSLVNYSLLYQPSMPPFCDVQTMYSLINKDILTQELLQVWGKHFSNLNNYSGTLNMQFTIEGLRLFLETGQVVEIPPFMLDHLPTPQQRVAIVRNFIQAIKAKRVVPCVLKTPFFNVPLPIVLVCYSKQNIVLHYFDQKNGIFFFTLEEISLLNAFHDFLTWNMTGDYAYTAEESLAMVEKELNDYL
jgi:hypothetical protein